MDDVPKEVLLDCAHLVKANSIQGEALGSRFRTETKGGATSCTAQLTCGTHCHRLWQRPLAYMT